MLSNSITRHREIVSCLFFIVVSVVAQENGGTLYCQEQWVVTKKVSLKFVVDASKFPAKCAHSNNQARFQKVLYGRTPLETNCTVSDITTPATCNGSFTPDSLGCGCTSRSGGFFVFEYNFVGHSDYNGWWSATIDCQDNAFNQVLSFSKMGCDYKEIQPTEFAAGIASVQGSQRTMSGKIGEMSRDIGENQGMGIASLVLISLLVVAIAVSVAFVVVIYKKVKNLDKVQPYPMK